ncbi:fluoride efflux transporter CrcB [Solibacillus isronensis]|uniref:fluoride efflux transporter CrcB n=1 Tax=Solibacillus isronensis TaxID=412383 RepID=UPI00203A6866|nr:fluoride efflux transporter CrcB [Solibacillus isronensis]MCM3723887.1 fluoride efflux transporter CrcB [Solibacillus isronensis]
MILIGIGGAIGAVLRYSVSLLLLTNETAAFPFATVAVNLAGCFLLGLLSSGLELKISANPDYLSAFKTGLIGSFTTFSTFSVEVIQLLLHHFYLSAILYIFISAIFGLIFVAFGMKIGKSLSEREEPV